MWQSGSFQSGASGPLGQISLTGRSGVGVGAAVAEKELLCQEAVCLVSSFV